MRLVFIVAGAATVLAFVAVSIYRRVRHGARLARYRELLDRVYEDRVVTDEEKEKRGRLKTELGLSDHEAREESLRLYKSVVQEAGADRELTAGERDELARLQSSLRISDTEIATEKAELDYLKFLSEVREGELPALDIPIALVPGETGHWYDGGEWTSAKDASAAIRAAAASGVRWNPKDPAPPDFSAARSTALPGGFAGSRKGKLVLTNQRLFLLGRKIDAEANLADVYYVELFRDGLILDGRDGPFAAIRTERPEAIALLLQRIYRA